MTDEKWTYIVDQIMATFPNARREVYDGELANEKFEEIYFQNDSGAMKLERHIKPRVIEEKTHYAQRAGATANVERVYSDTETVQIVNLYRDQAGEWVEMNVSALG